MPTTKGGGAIATGAPPLSVTGVWQSLRWPTLRDWAFTIKAWIAVVLCLIIGFSQNLLNPYWSVLTVYIVLMQPESGAIRSKAFYRLLGTVGGGLLIMAMTGVVGDQLGLLLALDIAVIVISTFARQIDRTPTNYIWFSGGLTAGFIGLVDLQTPDQIFTFSTARIAEISVGIIAMAAVDSLIWPKAMKPDFLATMADWHGHAIDWVTDALGNTAAAPPDPARRRQVRTKLRQLTETIGAIDAKAIQLPYDSVDAPPRRGDLHLLRRTVMRLVTDLAAIEEWTRAMRRVPGTSDDLSALLDAVSAWARGTLRDDGGLNVDEAAADDLRHRIDVADASLRHRRDRAGLVEHGILRRLDAFVGDWSDLAITMRSVATRVPLPKRLRKEVSAAKPVRSIDYVAAARDVMPMAVAMGIAAVLYYLFAWSSGSYALLFSFIGCAFLIGQPSTLRSGAGVLTWVSIAFVAVFFYQFAVLPRVTGFPVLVGVFAMFLIPVGLLLSMSLAGLFIAVFFFAFLSLQNTYTGSFEQSLLSLGGSMSGLMIAIISLHVLSYDKPRFTARRLARALRLDIADAASARRIPDRERFLQLTIDRLTQFFPAIDKLGDDDPLARVDMIDDLRIGLNVIALRTMRDDLPDFVAQGQDALLAELASVFRGHGIGEPLPDDLIPQIEALIRGGYRVADDDIRSRLLAALAGLRLALARDASPFDDEAGDEGGDAVAADAHEDAKEPEGR